MKIPYILLSILISTMLLIACDSSTHYDFDANTPEASDNSTSTPI